MSAAAVTAYIGLGANLGEAAASVRRALAQLGQLPQTRLTAQSSLFRTAPVDADGEDYVNAVAQLETRLPPLALLRELQRIEQDFGRERPYPNAPRTLDLDILLYGQQQIMSDELVVPHPRLTQRAFALIPLLQIDPLAAIPGVGPAHTFVPAVAGQRVGKMEK
ncbi:MAG: 2-amino-4-hydroxy-6-hydroxymethyldihydropteridine diphosphokinase [Burkholderiaceae bacterium]|nr:2-amino-4-hydroxy-6-hydroxymethyldihydropteridine diphosphokinase [Burkholderiaceae bacterium]